MKTLLLSLLAIGALAYGADSLFGGGGSGGITFPITTDSANPATVGKIRLANTEAIAWRNAAATADRSLAVDSGNALAYTGASAGSETIIKTTHSDNTNTGSNAKLQAIVGGASGGDPYLDLQVSGVTQWTVGIDNSDSDSLTIGTGAPGTGNILKLTTGGLVQVPAGTAAAPTVVGPSTASDSGLFFDGTTPCLARDGVPGACFSGAASYFGLPAGQAQYGMYYESNHFYVRGLSGNDSRIKTKMGTTTFAGGETYANVSGVRYKSTTATGNVGTGEDDLQSVSIVGNALGTNGESLIIESNGTLAANGNNKQVKLYFGSTVVADSGIVTINNGSYRCRAEVTRTAATTQIANGMCWLSDGTHTITVSNPTQTLSSATTVKATAEATDNDDISSKLFKVNYEPYGN